MTKPNRSRQFDTGQRTRSVNENVSVTLKPEIYIYFMECGQGSVQEGIRRAGKFLIDNNIPAEEFHE